LCPLKGMEPKDIDFVVIRENTEGPYVDRGRIENQGTEHEVAIQEDVNTYKGVRRIIRYAFEYCSANKKADTSPRTRVLMCDKSNAMTYAGGLWQRVFKEVAAEYPQIKFEHMYVDALCAQMVRDPRQFDVIVTNNTFGDIITDLAAGLQGGLGMAASGNIHPGRTSMFEPVHGSAPAIAGENIANPMGAILTAAMMLRHLGFNHPARRIESEVLDAIRQKKTTPDIGGTLGTTEVGDWIARNSSKLLTS
jgi:3-isopropylmalate dehydrogenase